MNKMGEFCSKLFENNLPEIAFSFSKFKLNLFGSRKRDTFPFDSVCNNTRFLSAPTPLQVCCCERSASITFKEAALNFDVVPSGTSNNVLSILVGLSLLSVTVNVIDF